MDFLDIEKKFLLKVEFKHYFNGLIIQKRRKRYVDDIRSHKCII